MKSDLPLSADALLAERTRLEEELQASEDWCELLRLKSRKARGEPMSAVNTARLEMVLIDALAEDPAFVRYKAVCVALERLIRGLPPVPPPKTEEPRSDDDLTLIRGVTPSMARRLGALDVTTFEQIANWSRDDIRYVSSELDLGRQIVDQRWVAQAAKLLAEADIFEADDGEEYEPLQAHPSSSRLRSDERTYEDEDDRSKGHRRVVMPPPVAAQPVAADEEDDGEDFDDGLTGGSTGETVAARATGVEPEGAAEEPQVPAEALERFEDVEEGVEEGEYLEDEEAALESITAPLLPAAANDIEPASGGAATLPEDDQSDDGEWDIEPAETAPKTIANAADDGDQQSLENAGAEESAEDTSAEDANGGRIENGDVVADNVSLGFAEANLAGAGHAAPLDGPAGKGVAADVHASADIDDEDFGDALSLGLSLQIPQDDSAPAEELTPAMELPAAFEPAASEFKRGAEGDAPSGAGPADSSLTERLAEISPARQNASDGPYVKVPPPPLSESQRSPVELSQSARMDLDEAIAYAAEIARRGHQSEPAPRPTIVSRQPEMPPPPPPSLGISPLNGGFASDVVPPPLPASYAATPSFHANGDAIQFQNGHAVPAEDANGEIAHSKVEIEEATVEIVRKDIVAEQLPPRMVIRAPDRSGASETQRPATPIGRFLKALTGNSPR